MLIFILDSLTESVFRRSQTCSDSKSDEKQSYHKFLFSRDTTLCCTSPVILNHLTRPAKVGDEINFNPEGIADRFDAHRISLE